MNTNVIPMFAFNDQQLRGIKIDGEPWFVAADACRCVGQEAHPAKGTFTHHLNKLDADERMLVKRAASPMFFMGVQGSVMTLVSRPGLFKLIQRSNKPEAKAFDRYVRHEVLPQIMDTGAYIGKDADVEAALERQPENSKRTDLDLMKTVMSAMQAMQERIGELENEAKEAAPKVAFVDAYVEAKGDLAFDTAAAVHGTTNFIDGLGLDEQREMHRLT